MSRNSGIYKGIPLFGAPISRKKARKKKQIRHRNKPSEKLMRALKLKRKDVTTMKRSLKKGVKSVPKHTFKLPVQTAVIVPSTYNVTQKISASQLKSRISLVRKGLSRLFGGYTLVRGEGGYYSDDKGRVVSEKSAIVVSYAQKDSFNRNKSLFLSWVKTLKTRWKQESIGIIIENDMFYVK